MFTPGPPRRLLRRFRRGRGGLRRISGRSGGQRPDRWRGIGVSAPREMPLEQDLSHWLALASSTSGRAQRAAAAGLGRSGSPRAVEPLLVMLAGPRPEVRAATE